MHTEEPPIENVFSKNVLNLIDSLRKDHYSTIDRIATFGNFQSFDWELYKKHAQEKFLIIFTLSDKDFTMTPKTITQLDMTQRPSQKTKSPPKHIFVNITLCHSRTCHRFLIKRCSKYLYQMLNEEKNDVYIASEVAIKLLPEKDELEVIFTSTLKSSYRKINQTIYDRFFSSAQRHSNIFAINEEEKEKVIAYNAAKRSKTHPSDHEWDVSEYSEADGSVPLQCLFRLKDYLTTIIGHIFKKKVVTMHQGESMCQIYLKLKDPSFIEGTVLYVRCHPSKIDEIATQFQEGYTYRFDRVFKMVSKKVDIYFSWNYNTKNMELLDERNADIKEQEMIAFDRMSVSYLIDIPRKVIYRKKLKLSGHITAILNLWFDFVCLSCSQPLRNNKECLCKNPAPTLTSSCFAIFQDTTALTYITAKNETTLELLKLSADDINKIKKYCVLNGKIELSRKDIEYYDEFKYGDMLESISKKTFKKTFIGIPKCNVNRGIDDSNRTKRGSIIPTEMHETEKRLFVNGMSYRKGYYTEEESYEFVPVIKVIKVVRTDTLKECYSLLNYYKNLCEQKGERNYLET